MTWTTTSKAVGARTVLRAGVSVTVLAASGALLLTACSSSSGSSGASGTATTASASGGATSMAAYRQCLSQHGVTLPSGRPSGGARPSGAPSGGGGGGGFGGGGGGFGGGIGGASPDAATQKALTACASLRPQGGGRGGFNSTALQAFDSCLKDHGVVVATPSPGATNRRNGLAGLNTADPKTAKAYTACKPLLPQRPSGTASASPTA